MYLTNTYKTSKGKIKEILVFKIYSMKPRKTFYALIELELNKNDFNIMNIMISPSTDRFQSFYKVKMIKNSMNTNCLFAGKDLFKNAFNAQGIDQ